MPSSPSARDLEAARRWLREQQERHRFTGDHQQYGEEDQNSLARFRAEAAAEATDEYREALEDMCHQFAYYRPPGALTAGGLSALESSFRVLGWDDPHPTPHRACDEPGCDEEATCGTPQVGGPYRRVCVYHFELVQAGNERRRASERGHGG